ncbi:hypothetical protein VNO80_01807 [Phaseolus coccineus]|uniref:Uncharacterized protein n=1 Tax=Phaseolus coccineus TaxID=3886 RepID=A0AAN9RTK9_PHACN
MGDRDGDGDVRIYLISGFFLACTLAGGVFLCVYVTYPDSTFIYLVAGMTLVAIPWFFWLLIYIYRWCKPMPDQFGSPARVAASKNRALTNVVANNNPGVEKAPDGGGGHHVDVGGVDMDNKS